MANFSARITAGATIVDWVDAAGVHPSRLNPVAGIPHRYYRTALWAALVVKCNLVEGGAEGAVDGTFGGAFAWEWSECPSSAKPIISLLPGVSSVASMTIVSPGNYLLGIYHPTRGAVFVRFACERP